jgi:hypothetical protein
MAGTGRLCGLWQDAAGTGGASVGAAGTPGGTATDLDETVGTPTGFETAPNGEGFGDLLLMKYDPDA